jgi:hypothetical protein
VYQVDQELSQQPTGLSSSRLSLDSSALRLAAMLAPRPSLDALGLLGTSALGVLPPMSAADAARMAAVSGVADHLNRRLSLDGALQGPVAGVPPYVPLGAHAGFVGPDSQQPAQAAFGAGCRNGTANGFAPPPPPPQDHSQRRSVDLGSISRMTGAGTGYGSRCSSRLDCFSLHCVPSLVGATSPPLSVCRPSWLAPRHPLWHRASTSPESSVGLSSVGAAPACVARLPAGLPLHNGTHNVLSLLALDPAVRGSSAPDVAGAPSPPPPAAPEAPPRPAVSAAPVSEPPPQAPASAAPAAVSMSHAPPYSRGLPPLGGLPTVDELTVRVCPSVHEPCACGGPCHAPL